MEIEFKTNLTKEAFNNRLKDMIDNGSSYLDSLISLKSSLNISDKDVTKLLSVENKLAFEEEAKKLRLLR